MSKLNVQGTMNNKGTHFSILNGLVIRSKERVKGNFDLTWFTKWLLSRINVPFIDPCCDSGSDLSPLRYNADSQTIEKLNTTSFEWEILSNASANFNSLGVDEIHGSTNSVTLGDNIVQKRTSAAINATATATTTQIINGLITSTSAAAVALTLPTATALGTALSASAGTSIDFIVDNTAGSNTVTVTVNTGITAIAGPVITGGATLTVASGTLGQFRIIFTSSTAAKIARLV